MCEPEKFCEGRGLDTGWSGYASPAALGGTVKTGCILAWGMQDSAHSVAYDLMMCNGRSCRFLTSSIPKGEHKDMLSCNRSLIVHVRIHFILLIWSYRLRVCAVLKYFTYP